MARTTLRALTVGGIATAAFMAALPATAVQKTNAKARDIVATASASKDFKTLTAAITAGDLAKTLQGKGPFTVLAPTEAAFAALPAGTLDSLVRPENKAQLVSLLTYHVLPGRVPAAQVVKVSSAKTVNGQSVRVKVSGKTVTVNDAKVTRTDIAASNGVIHAIDKVLVPSGFALAPPVSSTVAPSNDIVATAVAAGSFKTLAAALQAAGLVDTLKGPGPFTVFAPTDAAFSALPAGTLESLLKPENKGQLASILTYHVAAGRVSSGEVAKLTSVKTVNGASAKIKVDGGAVFVDDARVVTPDVAASNGIIHVIDKVILPPAA